MIRFKRKDLKVHFIGIGGIGMSGIAEVLLNLKYNVSGSDLANSPVVERLKMMGAEVFIGHQEENIEGATVVVYSSAVQNDNPEFKKAKELGLPVMRRAEMLAELMRLKHGIAVAGTHGKTTTTSFLATILYEAGLDPTYIIGGIVENLGGHAKMGQGDCLVAEADESDGSFLLLHPIMSIVTNIDNDHLDFYKSESNIRDAFTEFINRVPFYGVTALNIHDGIIQSQMDKVRRPYLTFGIESELADISAQNLTYEKSHSTFDIFFQGAKVGNARINIPGEHNVLNALGAITIANFMGIDFYVISKAVEKFDGVGRRFQTRYKSSLLEVIDDYGHHPTEIRATLETMFCTRSEKKIVVIFEPHRFTRTKQCWDDFVHCFNGAHKLFLCPIYPASEKAIQGINSEFLRDDINRVHPSFCELLENTDDLVSILEDSISRNENVSYLVMGAGKIGKVVKEWSENRKC